MPTQGYRPVPGRTMFELVLETGRHVRTTLSKSSVSCKEVATTKLRVVFVVVVYDRRYVRKILSIHPTPATEGPSYDLVSRMPILWCFFEAIHN